MNIVLNVQLETTLEGLHRDAESDYFQMLIDLSKSIFRPMQPSDFKNAYLSISKTQGEDIYQLIKKYRLKNIVEFGTSFGISTLYLAQGALETGGRVITTELLESKARKAIENFDSAGVTELIEVRIGDAMVTLKGHSEPVDLLLLDGWKDLYLPIFRMMEPNFHSNSFIYVDNADMVETRRFLESVGLDAKYQLEYLHNDKVVLIKVKNE